ncbi:MAG: hypothetical protein Q8M37_09245 [Nevskia sp.]|nr:hypothetical protein [Nevskia sp.]
MNGIDTRQLLAGLAASALLIGAAFATEPEPASSSAPAGSATATSSPDAEPRQPNCVRDTGTRIKPKKGSCVGLAGRSYSAEELSRTGDINPADALRRLDPSIGGSVR